MDNRTARVVAERVITILRQHAPNDPVLKDFTVADAGGSIGLGLTLKVGIMPKVIEIPKTNCFGRELTDDDVRMGLVPAGTPILYGGGKKGTVLNTRIKKYLFRDEATGKQYIISFRHCTLDKSRMVVQAQSA